MLTTLVGQPVSALDTPALLIDLEALDRNIASMAGDIRSRGVAWRPHTKAHKCPAIAHRQIAAGAIGVTCAKVGEAEVMAAAGIRDILISNQIVGPIKTRRLAALCGSADVMVAVDNLDNVRELSDAAEAAGTKPRVVIEIDTGMNRCGVAPRAALALAHAIASAPGLRFAGVMTWEGHTMAMEPSPERDAEIVRACQTLVATAEEIRASDLPVAIVSAGGSGTYLTSTTVPGITEVQAGGAIFGDAAYRHFGAKVEPALTIMAQVTSRPTPTRVIIDAGRKTVDPTHRPPEPVGLVTTGKPGFSAEHGTFTLAAPCDQPRIGERICLHVGYGDQCNHLHEQFFGIRNGTIETVWPILGRGRIQ